MLRLPSSGSVISLRAYFCFFVMLSIVAVANVAQAMDVDFPAGATIDGTIRQEINSKTAQDGQGFTMLTTSGSRIKGHLSEVQRANLGRKAHLKLNVDTITFTDGISSPISAEVIGVGQKKQTNYTQAAGTILGGMIAGNIVGKTIGTNIGGLIGVVGGSLLAANTSQDIIIPVGSLIRIKLTAPLLVRAQAR